MAGPVLGAPVLDGPAFAASMAQLGPWGAGRRVAVAVSGGADSLCLAWLAAGWGRPLGLIVDHGLRPDSGAEAGQAADRLASFGMEARIIRLHGLTRGPGLAARARAARYAVLARAMAGEGLVDLLLGHHASDQAETVLIRAESGSGPDGLAGMARVVETPLLRMVRPLLDVAPARLRSTLLGAGLNWAEDPSNADPLATRTRMRLVLAQGPGPEPALSPERVAGASRRMSREAARTVTLAGRASLFPQGYALLSPGPVTADCVAALIRALTGAAYSARGAALCALAADASGRTLGGIRFLPAGRLGPGTLLVREAAMLAPPVLAASGAVWDRRFVLHASKILPAGATLGALGGDARRLRDRSDLPDCVLRTLPALRAPDLPMAVPHLGQLDGWTKFDVRLTFRPNNPATGPAFHKGDAQSTLDHHVLNRAR